MFQCETVWEGGPEVQHRKAKDKNGSSQATMRLNQASYFKFD